MRRRIVWRIAVASALLALLVAFAFVVLIATLGEQRHALGDAVEAEGVVSTANDVERRVVDLETGLRGFLVTGNPRFLEPQLRAREELPGRLERLRRIVPANSPSQHQVDAIQRGLRDYLGDYALPLVELGRHDLARARAHAGQGEGKRRMDALRRRFERLSDAATATAADRRQAADERATRATVLGIACAIGSMALVGLFALYLTRLIVRPVRRVAGAARAVAAGNLAARAEAAEHAPAELGALARAFNHMAESLEQGRDELESQNAELERQQAELERALSDLEEEKDRIAVLHSFGELLSSETHAPALAASVLQRLADAVEAEVGTVYMAVPTGQDLELAATRGLARSALPQRLEPGQGLAWRALEEGRVVTAAHAGATLEVELLGRRLRVQHELHLPLRQGAQAIGVVSLARSADRPFDPSELDALARLGEQAAVALANARSSQIAQESAAFNEAVLDGVLGHAIISTDRQGTITVFNHGAELLLGYGAEELIGRETPGVFHDAAEVEARARELGIEPGFEVFVHAARQGEIETREWTYVRKDGRRLPVRLTVSAVRGADEQPLGFVGIARDITEQRRVERMKDEFFALVSHELRTPLTSIVGYVETLADMEAERLSEDGRRFLDVVSRNAAQLERLVDDLLLMAQIDAGKLSLQRGEVDVGQIAAEAVEAAQPRAAAGQVELRLRAEPAAPLHGDGGRLRQAIDNLVSNAIKFSPDGGCVEVSVDAHRHELVIAVSDTGVGIPEADQERLFQRFYRASTAEHVKGVGLGLTIVKAIAEGHGGHVGLDSREGEGTTFTLELPRNGSGSNGKEVAT